MRKFILGGLGAAGVAYAVLHLIYGGSTYAAAGPVSIPTGWLQTIGPAVVGLVWPMLAAKFPILTGILQAGLSFLKGKKPNTLRDVILQITELEVADAESGRPTTECTTARTAMLQRVASNAKAE